MGAILMDRSECFDYGNCIIGVSALTMEMLLLEYAIVIIGIMPIVIIPNYYAIHCFPNDSAVIPATNPSRPPQPPAQPSQKEASNIPPTSKPVKKGSYGRFIVR